MSSRSQTIENQLHAERDYRDVMLDAAERTAAWGGRSHQDRLDAYRAAAETCRRLSDALTDALRDEAMMPTV
jgi:acyl-CoA reductase-like NAD-dependent aldehyde dehydrogenase